MSGAATGLAQRAADLRAAFDRGFAEPVRSEAAAHHDLLTIRVGAEPYAIKLAEIVGLFAGRTPTPVPGGSAALIGIAGFRGMLVPVYSLRTLLGHAGTGASRWLVIAAAAPVALAFDAFEAHARVPVDAVAPRQSHDDTRAYAAEFIRTAAVVRPILHLPSIIDALDATPAPSAQPTWEQMR